MQVNIVTRCNGVGYWSHEPGRIVRINRVELNYVNTNKTFGELIAFFNAEDWDRDVDGLIYTDEMWIRTFRWNLKYELDLSWRAVKAIDYSEQGMQGGDYVSMDVTEPFLKEFSLLKG